MHSKDLRIFSRIIFMWTHQKWSRWMRMLSPRGNSLMLLGLRLIFEKRRRSEIIGMRRLGCVEMVAKDSIVAGFMTTMNHRLQASRFGVMFLVLSECLPSLKCPSTLRADMSNLDSERLEVTTNNPAAQVYTGYWLNTPRKQAHGGPSLNYTKWSAVAIEQEGYIDAINTPEWGVDQIYYPGKDYEWSSTYRFSVVH